MSTTTVESVEFTYHTEATAPAESQAAIEQSHRVFGFLPKLHAVMAEAPAMLGGYHSLWDLFLNHSSLSPLEQQVVMMTANYENNCHYCVPGHTYIMTASKMPQAIIDGLREGTILPDPRLESLRSFSRLLIENRGHVGDEALHAFLDSGFTRRQALEVIVGLSLKVLSNYTNALAHTELDAPVKKFAWTHP